MFELDIEALLLGHTGHVHQARAVRTGNVFSASLHVTLYLVESHLGRDSRLLDREHATKATALIRTLGLYDVDAVNQLQQVFYLIELLLVVFRRTGEPQLANTMTGIV